MQDEPIVDTLSETEPAGLHRDEQGAISVFFVFGVLALVLLLGALFNTAQQTTRKVEMQGATDAAAVAGGAWVARGLNLVTFNNCGMADVLAVMVVVHAYNMTLEYANIIIPAIYQVLQSNPYTAAIGALWEAEWQILYNVWHNIVDNLDDILSGDSGIGWKIMEALDLLNQGLKLVIPGIATGSAVHFAQANGAEKQFLLPNETTSSSKTSITLPIDRGKPQLIAERAEQCPAPALSVFLYTPVTFGIMSYPIMFTTYQVMLEWNWNSLQDDDGDSSEPGGSSINNDALIDQSVEQILDQVQQNPSTAVDYLIGDLALGGLRTAAFMNNHSDLEAQFGNPEDGNFDTDGFTNYLMNNPEMAEQYVRETRYDEIRSQVEDGFDDADIGGAIGQNADDSGGGGGGDMQPLEWPDDPPKPMILDAKPDDEDETDENLENIAKFLQYLSVAWAPMKSSPLGPEHMRNRAAYGWMTYGQSHVYNPSKWDLFTQDWRVKLVRAELFESKFEDAWDAAEGEFDIQTNGNAGSADSWEYVNNH